MRNSEGTQNAHGAVLVQFAAGPALAAGSEGALVAKPEVAVLASGSTALGADLSKAQGVW